VVSFQGRTTLLEEEVGGDHRRERALAVGETKFVAVLADESLGTVVRQLALDATQGLGDSKHGGLRCRMFGYQTTSCPEAAA
jgi:hypothetical protein